MVKAFKYSKVTVYWVGNETPCRFDRWVVDCEDCGGILREFKPETREEALEMKLHHEDFDHN